MRLFLFFLLTVAPLAAQQGAPDSAAAPPDSLHAGVKLFIEKIEVEGTLEKPQAVFILPGRSPEIDDIVLSRSFFNELFRPVEKRPPAQP